MWKNHVQLHNADMVKGRTKGQFSAIQVQCTMCITILTCTPPAITLQQES